MHPRNASAEITPSDDDNLVKYGQIYVTIGGTVKFDLVESGTLTHEAEDGEVINFLAKKIYATGTSASGLHIVW